MARSMTTDNETNNSPYFSPVEIEAMRFAFRQMLETYPNRYMGENDKRELARSILEALGKVVTKEREEKSFGPTQERQSLSQIITNYSTSLVFRNLLHSSRVFRCAASARLLVSVPLYRQSRPRRGHLAGPHNKLERHNNAYSKDITEKISSNNRSVQARRLGSHAASFHMCLL